MTDLPVTGPHLTAALKRIRLAHATGTREQLGDATADYIHLLLTSRTWVILAHLAGLSAGTLAGRLLPLPPVRR